MPIKPLLVVLLWCGLAVGAPAGGDLLTGREFLDVFLRRTQPHFSDTHNAIPHKGEHDHAFVDELDEPTTTDLPDMETTTELEETTTEGPTTLVETTRIERSTTEADWREHPSQVVSVRVSSSVVRARPEVPQHEDKTVSVSYRVEAKIADSVAAASQVVEEPIKANQSDYAHAEALTYHRVKLGDDPANTPVSYETSVSSASSGSSVRFYRQPPSYNYRPDDRQQRNFREQTTTADAYAKSEVFPKPNAEFLKSDIYRNTPVDYSKPEYSKPQDDYKVLDYTKQPAFTKSPHDFTKQPSFNNPEQDFRENSDFGKRKTEFAITFSTPLPEYTKPPVFTHTETFMKTDQQYGKSEQVYNKPEAYIQPHQTYGKPQESFVKPAEAYGKPEQVYGKPEQVYGKPEQVYGKPEQVYGKPEEDYGKPEQVYGKPAEVYGKPEQVYGKPAEAYGKPEQIYGKPEQVYGKPEEAYKVEQEWSRKPSANYDKPDQLYGKREEVYKTPQIYKPADEYNKPDSIYSKSEQVFGKTEAIFNLKPEQAFQKSDEVFTKSEEAYVKAEEAFGKREPEYRKIDTFTAKTATEELPKPERVYAEPERVYGEPEQNYEIDEAVSVATNGRAHGVQDEDAKDKHKFGYVVEGRNFRKYRVEERTADGFIVGEYGVVSHDDGSLRGVRYTADSNINPRLIYDALVKFLSLK